MTAVVLSFSMAPTELGRLLRLAWSGASSFRT